MRPAIAAVILAAALGSQGAYVQAGTNTLEIPEGMRAIAVGVHAIPVNGSVKAGDRVELLTIYSDPQTGREVSKTIMKGALVLAVGKSVTLAATPEQAELIAAADREGTLAMSTRWIKVGHASSGVRHVLPEGSMVSEEVRDLALNYLRERYPNVDPNYFDFEFVAEESPSTLAVVFAERDSATDDSRQLRYADAIQYLVRVTRDGELLDIQRQERRDGILKIWPAPDQGI